MADAGTDGRVVPDIQAKRKLHTNNIFKEKELSPNSVVKDSLTTATDGKKYRVKYYNLDVIISVGYRVKSIRGTQFRQWANKVLKDYLLKGYSVNRRLTELEHTVAEHSRKIDFFVRTSLPPVEGVFYDGQIFDAYKFATDLIRSADVKQTALQKITAQLQLDIERHNRQYPPVEIRIYNKCHDRFLIIDNTEVYHIGASLKDLGKKMFAFSRLDIPADTITKMFESRDIGTEYDFCKLPGHDLSESE